MTMLEGSDADGIDFPYDEQKGEPEDYTDELVLPQPVAQASMTYTWPSTDPQYWQDLMEYVIEADGDRNIPTTLEEFLLDFLTYRSAKSSG